MKAFFACILIFSAASVLPQEIKSYSLDVNINVESKSISVEGEINVDFKNEDSVKLILWKNSKIHEVSILNNKVRYYFDTLSASPMYIHNGKTFVIFNDKKSNSGVPVKISYQCDFKNLNGWARSFTNEWIELNFYSAWFPVGNGGNSTSIINITIDEGYSVSGSGVVTQNGKSWRMEKTWGSFDNVIIASNNLKLKNYKKNNCLIETCYSNFSNSDADSILSECNYVLNLFQNLFGKIENAYFKFAVAPFEKGGGYSRKNFVRMGTMEYNRYTQLGIAHEVAHFWWSAAVTSTWEDWLNEAFAEYSMLIYFRDKYGKDKFDELVEEYKSRTKNLPCIWGIDRNSPEAYSTIYEKGSLILCEMENKIGTQIFFKFLKEISENKIRTTTELLDLVERKFSAEIRQWLENKLKTA